MQKKSYNRFLALILSVALLCGILPMTVLADDSDVVDVTYYLTGDSGTTATKTCQVVTADTDTWTGTASEPGWYVVNNQNEILFIENRIEVSGTVNLILANDAIFSPEHGIHVGPDSSLTIYQSVGDISAEFTIWANSMAYGYAGIGGDEGELNGNITICGGCIHVNAYGGAAIGSGAGATEPTYKTITINGGYVATEVESAGGSAGIGGGNGATLPSITINGGEIVTKGADYAAGIGSGKDSEAAVAVFINGGTISATGGIDGAGIGSGLNGVVSAIHLNGGTITATGQGVAPGVGGYAFSENSSIYFGDNNSSNDKAIVTLFGGAEGGAGAGSAAEITQDDSTICKCNIVIFNDATLDIQGGKGAAGIGGGYGVPSDIGFTFNPGDHIDVSISAGLIHGDYGQAIGDGVDASRTGTTSFSYQQTTYSGYVVLDENDNLVEKTNRAEAFKQKKVSVEICEHPDAFVYEPYLDNEARHRKTFACKYCDAVDVFSNSWEKHEFDPQTHTCACQLREYEVQVNNLESDEWYLLESDDKYAAERSAAYLLVYVDDLARKLHVVSATYVDPVDNQVKEINEIFTINSRTTDDDRIAAGIRFIMPAADITFEIHPVMNVTFDTNGSSESMEPVEVDRGSKYTLPECAVEAPEGKYFSGWKVNDSERTYIAGTQITVTTDVVLQAQWTDTVCHHDTFTYEASEAGHVKICSACGCQLGSEEAHVDEEEGKDHKCDLCGADVTHVYFVWENETDAEIYEHVIIPRGAKVARPEDPKKAYKVFDRWVNVSDGEPFDFDTLIDEKNIALAAIWDDEKYVIMKSASVVFTAGLQLQFTMELSDAFIADPDASIVFMKGETEVTPSSVSEDGNTRVYRVDVPILEFRESIVVKVNSSGQQRVFFYHPDGVTTYTDNEFIYSMLLYVQDVITDDDTDASMKMLAAELLSYYEYACQYFLGSYGTVGPHTNPNIDQFTVTDEMNRNYGAKKLVTDAPGVIGTSLNVLFESDNALRLAFRLGEGYSPDDYTFQYFDGKTLHTVEPVSIGQNRWAILVEDIAAPNLGYMFKFVLTHKDTGSTYEVSASVYSYCFLAAKTGSENMQGLAKALYCYGAAAYEYFVNSSENGN